MKLFRDILIYLIKARRKLSALIGSISGRIVLFLWNVKVGKNLRINSYPLVFKHKDAIISIGDNVSISNSLLENPAGVVHRTVLAAVNRDSKIIIGNNVGISGAIIYASKEIIIDDYSQIGANCKIYDTDFHPIGIPIEEWNKKGHLIKSKPVHIGKGVFIGADSIILKGVEIEEGSVVAAGSIVTKSVGPYTIVGGNPAREIRKIR